jgi:hypothetical protein
LRGTREEKGKELKRKVKKEGKKKQFFFNRLRGHRAGKKNGEHVLPTKKPQYREKEKKKRKNII